jgi:glycosyltransferase involved in cell wall biosynthesis
MSSWLDVELLVSVARSLADHQFVLVGPWNIDLSALRGLPNLHILGPRPYADMPSYFRHADVGVIPFRRTELTDCFNPVKLFDYFAAGLPVVSTDLAEVRRLASPAWLASDAPAFTALVAGAVGRRDAPEHRAFARANDWQRRFEVVDSLIARALDSRART